MSEEESSSSIPHRILTKKQTMISFGGLFAAIFAWGISFAGLIPMMALSLESQGYSSLMIGVLGAITPVGVILAAPLVPFLVRRFGTSGANFLTSFCSLLTIVLLPVFDSYESWLVLRFMTGIFSATPWIVTEAWLNSIAHDGNRGRMTAIYGTVMAGSFAIGPLILTIIGTQGVTAYIFSAIAMAISLVPLLFIWHLAPVLHLPKGVRLSGFIKSMPSILAAGLLCGMTDMVFFNFLPIWGLRVGFDENTAILLLSLFVLGNIVLQLPICWLADRTDRYKILIVCGFVGIIGPVVLTVAQTFGSITGIAITLFFWGGFAWALYTVSLAIIGERYKGGSLTAASAAFVVAYEIANIAGPPLAGIAFELWQPHGLMVFVGVCAVLFCCVIIYRHARTRA